MYCTSIRYEKMLKRMVSVGLVDQFWKFSTSSSKSPLTTHYDVVVVGGGIVGVAAARELLLRAPELKCAVVEKETRLACHQSGRNSGVIHAGIYYKPGSDRALLCAEGIRASYEYFDKKGVPYRKVGKLIVATEPSQVPGLEELYRRGQMNGVNDLRMISGDQIKEIEPHCKGVKALHSPNTGIVDWGLVTQQYGLDFAEMGGHVHLGFEVNNFTFASESTSNNNSLQKYPVAIRSSSNEELRAGFVLCCAGLYADKIAEMTNGPKTPAIVPFRGEYLKLSREKEHLVRGNIYPVPDPKFPFLGVHFTPKMDGSVLLGPNAVLAFGREGYKYSDISLGELKETLAYPGFQKLAIQNFRFGLVEMVKSVVPSLQVQALRKFIPEITAKDIVRGPSGVRAQAMNEQGEFVDDFIFEGGDSSSPRVLHCRNAPSPGATSSLAIGRELIDRLLEIMKKTS